MQFVFDAPSLKSFSKAVTCLSKYGDELTIYGTSDSVALSATNSSKSAYCRFKYDKTYFSRYVIGKPRAPPVDELEDTTAVTGQLLTKSLLSILRHRTVEKTVERCEMSIDEGGQDGQSEEGDSLESKLIVRFLCKHGVIKTHRLILLTPTSLMAPGVPDSFNESNFTIGPKTMKDMIEHFPVSRGAKSDPQLVWTFKDSEVELKSLEAAIDARGKAQLATELTISAEEFDAYEISSPPTTIAFHLREFNATIAYADSMSLSLDLRFTEPAAPLFIEIERDEIETLFVISTSQVTLAGGNESSQNASRPDAVKKREREETPMEVRNKKPMKAAQRVDVSQVSRLRSTTPNAAASSSRGSMGPPPSLPTRRSAQEIDRQQVPLFLPSSSQLSTADREALAATGLGVEDMDLDDLSNMLEGEGEEVAFDFASQRPAEDHNPMPIESLGRDMGSGDSFELVEDAPDSEFPPTQASNDSGGFQALFED